MNLTKLVLRDIPALGPAAGLKYVHVNTTESRDTLRPDVMSQTASDTGRSGSVRKSPRSDTECCARRGSMHRIARRLLENVAMHRSAKIENKITFSCLNELKMFPGPLSLFDRLGLRGG